MKKLFTTCVFSLSIMAAFAQQQWKQVTSYPGAGASINDLMSSGNHLFAVTPGAGTAGTVANIYQSTDGGVTWQKADSSIPSAYGGHAIYYDQYHQKLIYGSNAQYGCYTATDLNNPIWTRITTYIRPTGFAKIDTTLFFTDQISGVFKTLDDCNSWTLINPPTGNPYAYAILAKGDSLMVSMQFGGTYRSYNKGSSWTQVNSGMGAPTNAFVNTYAQKDSFVFGGTYYYGVIRTSTFGTQWMQVNNGLPTLAGRNYNSFLVKGDSVFVGTDTTGVYLSVDNGNNWSSFNNGMPANTTINKLVLSNGKIFAGTNNGILYRLDNPTVVPSAVNNITAQVKISVYPNPANNTIHLHSTIAGTTMQLQDLTGAICWQQRLSGNDGIIDVQNFPSGIYVLKTDCGQQQKIVIAH